MLHTWIRQHLVKNRHMSQISCGFQTAIWWEHGIRLVGIRIQVLQIRVHLRVLKAQLFGSSRSCYVMLRQKLLRFCLLILRINLSVHFWFRVAWSHILQFSFGSSTPILKPVVHICFRNLTMLAQLSSYLFDFFLAWSSISLIKYTFKNLKLHRCRCPPLSWCYFVSTRCHQWITVQISQSCPWWGKQIKISIFSADNAGSIINLVWLIFWYSENSSIANICHFKCDKIR